MGRSSKAKLSLRTVDAVSSDPTGDVFVWDTALPGFALRVRASGSRQFVVRYRNRFGRQRWYTIGRLGVLTPDEARTEAKRVLADVTRGEDPAERKLTDRRALTVAELCRDYLDKAEKGLLLTRRGTPKKAYTVYVDRGRVERHIIPLLGSKAAREVTSADIRQFIRDVTAGKTATSEKTERKRGKAIVKGGAGAATRAVGLLGAIYTYAIGEGLAEGNPVRGVVRPSDKRRETRLDREAYREVGKALDAASERGEDHVALDAIRAIALTGARRGEVIGLRGSEIDEPGRCLRLASTKTGASIRPLGAPAIELLKKRKPKKPDGYVFSAKSGDAPIGNLVNVWRRVFASSAVPHLTPHGLRHSFATVCDDLGMSLPTIGALLGHTSKLGVTAGYVARRPDPALLAMADLAANWIDAAMRGKAQP